MDLLSGFDDYATQSNAVFRTCLQALSRPGQIADMRADLAVPQPLIANAAAVFLTLADFETTFWLDEPLAAGPEIVQFLRFHTGAAQVTDCGEADFAVVADSARMPDLARFMQGTPEFPDRSTTVIVQVAALETEGWRFEGPGIQGACQFSARPLPDGFKRQLASNRSSFPCGVDLIFTSDSHVAALPRSVTLQG